MLIDANCNDLKYIFTYLKNHKRIDANCNSLKYIHTYMKNRKQRARISKVNSDLKIKFRSFRWVQ